MKGYIGCVVIAVGLLVSPLTRAAQPLGHEATVEEFRALVTATMEKGFDWLATQQREDGSFGDPKLNPAVTALVIRAAAISPMRETLLETETFNKAIAYLRRRERPDGGIYAMPYNTHYHTAVALSALAALRDERDGRLIKNAQRFLRGAQADEDDNVTPADPDYGGWGYDGKTGGADLSNVEIALSGLQESGLAADSEVWTKALRFVERCQQRDLDGGFIYRHNESKAGVDPRTGRYRSYGTMTYAGLLSMICCNVTKDDERVQAAVAWLKTHFTVEENYPMGVQGLYYGYHTMAKALHAYGEKYLVDEKGVRHDWYRELATELMERQHDDGYWVNTESRWFEDDKHLVTAYALLALAEPLRGYK